MASPGRYRVRLQATHAVPAGTMHEEQQPVDLVSFDVHVLAGPSCGTNGHAVHNRTDDPAANNNTFVCDCGDTGWDGATCDTPPGSSVSSAAADGDHSAAVVGASLGLVLAILLAVLSAYRIQISRLKHRPVDVNGMQQALLESLGLGASTDIGADEFGISLSFDRSPHDAAGQLSDRFREDLVSTLRNAVSQLRASLQTGPKFTSAGPAHTMSTTTRMLVVMPKAKGVVAEAVVETLVKLASKGSLVLGSGHSIVDASVAVPSRVPREIARPALTRIKLLGEGMFGEVHQY